MKLKYLKHYLTLYAFKRQIKCSEGLNAPTASFRIDGWSNIQNKPILCAVVTAKKVKII